MAHVLGDTPIPITEASPSAAPARASGVELLGAVRGSGYRRPPCLVRLRGGQTVQLTPLLYTVLDAIDGERDLEAIAAAVTDRTGRLASAEDVAFLIGEKLQPLGVLRLADGTEPVIEKPNPLLGLRLKFVVSKPDVTRRVTAPFAPLFHWWVVVPVLAVFVAITWWLLFDKGLGAPAHEAIYNPALLLGVLALTIISGGFHEFGHAAACRYGGATPGAMGGAMYLVWPAFYTDVTDSYRLGRGGRLRVDLGGLYFNAVFAVVMFAAWTITRWDAVLLLIPAQLAQMGRQLAPFIRADGYHIIADAIGVPDLFAHIKPTLLSFLPTHWGSPGVRALKLWARALITLWVLIVVPMLGLMLAFCVLTLPRIASTAWDSAGRRMEATTEAWGSGDVASVLLGIAGLFAIALPALGAVYLIDRSVRHNIVRAWRKTDDRPLGRAALIAGLIVLAGLVAWAWWPDGQYKPIAANERGRVQDVVRYRATPAVAVRTVDDAAVGRFTTAVHDAEAPPGAIAQRAMVLIPRGDAGPAPTVIVPISTGDEASTAYVVPDSGSSAPGESRDGWVFPFDPPPAPAEGDNQAVAVNTTDGSTVYDVAFALVWVTDGDDVEHRNEAWALASCVDCKTVSVAFQVVFTVGRTEVVTPLNAAVAANYECVECATHAIAVQLVATLNAMPTDDVMAQIDAVWSRVDDLGERVDQLSVEEIYLELKAIEAQLLTVLIEAGVPVETDRTESAGSTDATHGGTATPTSAPSTTAPAGHPAPSDSSSSTTQPQSATTSEEPTTTSTTSTTSSTTSTPTTTSTTTTAPEEPATSTP